MRNLKDIFEDKKIQQNKSVHQQQFDEKTIFFVFKKVFRELYGIKGEENIEPVQVFQQKLFLKPRTSLWANEVLLQKRTILQKINEVLQDEYLVDIIITQRSEESFRS